MSDEDFIRPSEEARDEALNRILNFVADQAVGLSVQEILWLADCLLHLCADVSEDNGLNTSWEEMFVTLGYTHTAIRLEEEAAR